MSIFTLAKLINQSWARQYQLAHHPLKYLFWECTLNCNFKCKHCGSSAGNKIFKNEVSQTLVKKVFTQIAQKLDPKQILIAVTGGEPLLCPHLFTVMKHASKLGFPWGIVTNGSLVTPTVVTKMKRAGMGSASVSIDGLDSTHDEFRQFPGSYQKAIRAIKLLAKANFLEELQITTVVHRQNIHQLQQMYQAFSKLNINSWRVVNIDPIGRAKTIHNLLLDSKQLKHLLDFIKTKRKISKFEVTYSCSGFLGPKYEGQTRSNFFYCSTGINTASILHNGDIFVCPNVPRLPRLVQGNIKKDNFLKVWDKKFKIFRRPDRTACKDCLSCQYWQFCQGSSFHLWDFDKKKPQLCHLRALET